MQYLMMPLYNFFLFFIPFCILVILTLDSKNNNSNAVLLFFYLVAISVFLINKPIIGGDILEYYQRFELGGYYYNLEPVFGWWTELIRFISDAPAFYVVTLALSCLFLQVVVIVFICDNKILAVIFLLCNSFVLLTWSGVYRSGLSVPFLLLSFYFIFHRKNFISFFLLVLSITIHNSAFIFVPIWLSVLFYKFPKRFVEVGLLLCIFLIVSNFFFDINILKELISTMVINIIVPIVPYEYARPLRYFTAEVSQFNTANASYLIQTSKVTLEILFQVLLFSILYFTDTNKDKNSDFWGYIYICSIILYVFTIGIVFSYRFYLVSSFIWCVYKSFRSCYFKGSSKQVLGGLLIVAYSLFSFYSLPPEKVGLMYFSAW